MATDAAYRCEGADSDAGDRNGKSTFAEARMSALPLASELQSWRVLVENANAAASAYIAELFAGVVLLVAFPQLADLVREQLKDLHH